MCIKILELLNIFHDEDKDEKNNISCEKNES